MQKFGEEVIRFFNLGIASEVIFYFSGLSVYVTADSYEKEISRIVDDVQIGLRGTPVRKIGLTTYPHIAAKRKEDIEAMIGEVFTTYYDGILIIPRPSEWSPQELYRNHKVERTYNSIASLIPRTELGIIALNLDQDHTIQEINSILGRIMRDFGCEAEIVRTQLWDSQLNIMVKHGAACVHEREPTYKPPYAIYEKAA